MVLGVRAFRRCLSHEVGAVKNEICALIEETPGSSLQQLYEIIISLHITDKEIKV